MFQRLAELKVRRERDLLMLSAEQMYRQFTQSSPDLLDRIPQKDLLKQQLTARKRAPALIP